jgi:hypothetical protein
LLHVWPVRSAYFSRQHWAELQEVTEQHNRQACLGCRQQDLGYGGSAHFVDEYDVIRPGGDGRV